MHEENPPLLIAVNICKLLTNDNHQAFPCQVRALMKAVTKHFAARWENIKGKPL